MIKNLIGQHFNDLEVIDGPFKKNKKIYWRCKCKCGIIKEVRADSLKNGRTKSCGCYKKSIIINGNIERQTLDLTNKRFGKLIAKEKTDKRTNDGRIIWKCICDCGNEIEVNTHDLQQGKIQSCGCLKSKGEYIIASLLSSANIPFIKQKKFENCKFEDTGYYARFDFFVNNQYLIEFDGEQHFYYNINSTTSWNTKENFDKVKQHDDFKNNWCKKNQIPLIRIPYKKLATLSLEDLILETSQFILS